MTLRHVIVHVDGSDRAATRVALAAGLCRDPRSRLTGLFAEDVTVGSSIVGRRSPDAIRASMQAAQAGFLATAAAVGARADAVAVIGALLPDEGGLEEIEARARALDRAIKGETS